MFIFALLFVGANALIAFDCNSKSVNLTSISLVTTPSCEQSVPNITYSSIQLAVTQSTDRFEVEFSRCKIETLNSMGRCGFFKDKFQDSSLYSEVIYPSREECLKMLTKGEYRIYPNGNARDLTIQHGRNKHAYMSRGSVNSEGSCTAGADLVREGRTYTKPVVSTEISITVSKGTALVSIEENLIRFPSGNTCKFSDRTCFDADYGNIFWDIPLPSCDGPESEKSLIYEGPGVLVTDYTGPDTVEYVHVNYGGYDFQVLLKNEREVICGYNSRLTEHPRLFVTMLPSGGPKFSIRRRISAVDVSLLNFVNSKLVYSFRHIKQEVTRLFDLFNLDRCKAHNRITQNMMTLALLSPHDFAYMYGGPGYTAVTRGEVIYLAKCKPVSVLPDLETKGCFNELPVVYTNKTVFLTPRSRIILNVGSPIPCLPDLLPKYFINDMWYIRTDHGLIDTLAPQTVRPDVVSYKFKELKGITGGGLYKADMIRRYQEALISPMVETVISSRVVGSLKGDSALPAGYQYSAGFTPLDYDSIKENIGGFWSALSSAAVKAGGWFGFVLLVFGLFKMFLYTVSVVVNFAHLRPDVGIFWAAVLCLFETLCNLFFHGKILKEKAKKKEVEEDKGEELAEFIC